MPNDTAMDIAKRFRPAYKRLAKMESRNRGMEKIGDFFWKMIENRREDERAKLGRESEDRAAQQRREEEERKAQRRKEEIAGAQDFTRERDAAVVTRQQDKEGLERQQQNETERILNPLETQYGELSRQLVAINDPAQKQQIAADMGNLELRIARMGGQVKTVSEILQTQQLLNPQQAQSENPELDALIDEIESLTDGPMDPGQRISIGILTARLRKGDVQSMDEIFDMVQSAMGGDEETPGVEQFSQVDVNKAIAILTDEEGDGGFDLDAEELDKNAFTDPVAFSREMKLALADDSTKFSMGQAKATALLNKYTPEPVDESGMKSLLKKTFLGEFDAESLYNRPKSPQEAYQQATEFMGDEQMRAMLMDPQGRRAINEDLGPGSATLLSIHLGINPNIGTAQNAFGN